LISIDTESCTNCNLCYKVCVGGAVEKGPSLPNNSADICIECGHCVAACPEDAITLAGFEGLRAEPLAETNPVSEEQMMSMLRARRSCREYKPVPVSREDVEKIIEAASLAPSAHNSRPVIALVYDDPEVIEKINRHTLRFFKPVLKVFKARAFKAFWNAIGLDPKERLLLAYGLEIMILPEAERGDTLLYDARTLLVFTAPRFNPMAVGDGWLAAQTAVLFAETIGVGTCYNGYVNMAANMDPVLRRIMGIPRGRTVAGVLTLGYPTRRYYREAPRKVMDTTWN